jgi:hypothetical protein
MFAPRRKIQKNKGMELEFEDTDAQVGFFELLALFGYSVQVQLLFVLLLSLLPLSAMPFLEDVYPAEIVGNHVGYRADCAKVMKICASYYNLLIYRYMKH